MKVSVCCCTYNRPHLLGELIQSYLIQDYPRQKRELIILDDAGQYENQEGDGWELVSIPRRFSTLGDKRNACASLASFDSDAILIADDDDIFMKQWISSVVSGLEKGVWTLAGWVYHHIDDKLNLVKSGATHSTAGFRKKEFWEVGGYPSWVSHEDSEFFQKMKDRFGYCIFHTDTPHPYLIRRFGKERIYTTAQSTVQDYQSRPGKLPQKTLTIGWNQDYWQMICDYRSAQNMSEQVE